MILVTGATGQVGRAAVRRLTTAGRPVRALVRHVAAAAEFEALGAVALVGDLTRETDRAAAVHGIESVVACHSAFRRYDHLQITEVDGEATEALIGDAVAAGVRHFTLVSHLQAELPGPTLRLAAKLRAERALRAQEPMAYTILRIPPLFESLLHLPGLGDSGDRRTLLQFGPGQARFNPVAADDVAQMALAAAQCPEAWNRIVAVGGPETYTWRELPGLLERAWGAPVTCWRFPLFVLPVLRLLVGLVRPSAGDRLGYLETLLRHDFTADPTEAATLFGIGLDDLVSWLQRDGQPPALGPDLSDERPPARSVEPAPTAVLDEPETDLPSRTPEPVGEGEAAAPAADWPAPEQSPRLELTPPPAADPVPPAAEAVPERISEPAGPVPDEPRDRLADGDASPVAPTPDPTLADADLVIEGPGPGGGASADEGDRPGDAEAVREIPPPAVSDDETAAAAGGEGIQGVDTEIAGLADDEAGQPEGSAILVEAEAAPTAEPLTAHDDETALEVDGPVSSVGEPNPADEATPEDKADRADEAALAGEAVPVREPGPDDEAGPSGEVAAVVDAGPGPDDQAAGLAGLDTEVPEPGQAGPETAAPEEAGSSDADRQVPEDEPVAERPVTEEVKDEATAETVTPAAADDGEHAASESALEADGDGEQEALGRRAEFRLLAPVGPGPGRRPPVERPRAIDGLVVDADPE